MADPQRGAPTPRQDGNPGPHSTRRTVLLAAGTGGLGLLAGCTGGGDTGSTETATPPPETAAVPYTSTDDDQNTALVRDLRVWNNTERDQRLTISLTELATGTRFYRRTVTIESKTEPRFRDLIAKKGVYEFRLDLEVGMSKTFEWPVDDAHGNARAVVGGDPVDPTITFRVEPL